MEAGVTLYLVRHAVAAERGPDYPDDSLRPLTTKGAQRFFEAVLGMVASGVEVDEILTSPYVRARQTAELLAQGFEKPPKITNVHALVEAPPVEIIDTLTRYARRKRLALVGHAPGIGQLAARLLGHRRALEFRKGAVACIEIDALPLTRPGELAWFMPVRLLRRLAQAR